MGMLKGHFKDVELLGMAAFGDVSATPLEILLLQQGLLIAGEEIERRAPVTCRGALICKGLRAQVCIRYLLI